MRVLAAFPLLTLAMTGCAANSSSSPLEAPTPHGDAGQQLRALKVAPEGSGAGYDRKRFPHWSTRKDGCDTRELVLKRDGRKVRSGGDCSPRSGRWSSPYDGKSRTRAADLDVDHMVPLAEAWRSGARGWTRSRREEFANDLEHPQLWTVTDSAYRAKGDQDPAEWKPPRRSFWCRYARSWISVKHTYRLTVDAAEKRALAQLLTRCRRPAAIDRASPT